MPWPSGQPPWQVKDLQNLASSGQLSGVNPLVLAGIAQEESGFEVAGAGYNSSGYGGFYGLGTSPYAGGNQESVASLKDPSEASFLHQSITAAAAFNSYMQQAVSEGYTGNDITNRAESIFQRGGGIPGIESGGGVALVDQALGTGSNTGGTTTQGTAASGATLSNINSTGQQGGQGQNSGTALPGVAGILQQLNELMNPTAIGGWTSVLSLGTANVAQVIELVAVRGAFAIAFGVIAYVGLKQITGGAGTSVNIPNPIDEYRKSQRNELSQQRIDAHNRATEQRATSAQTRADTAASGHAASVTNTKSRVAGSASVAKTRADAAKHSATTRAKSASDRTSASIMETVRKANPDQPVKRYRTDRFNNSAQTGYRTPINKGGTRRSSPPKNTGPAETAAKKTAKSTGKSAGKKAGSVAASVVKDVIEFAPK